VKVPTLGALLIAAGFAAPPGQLTVLRVHPTAATEAPSNPEVTVTFDRPVAGGLDGAVDPKTFFRITPAVAGRLEWRDPITVRFVPTAPLTPGTTYTVTVLNNFEAMDGTRLRAPFTFTFDAAPARIIAGSPIGGYEAARFIAPRPVIRLLLSAPGDPRMLAQNSFIVMSPQCGGTRIPLDLVRMRRVTEQDDRNIRYAGSYGAPGDTLRDIRRVVELRPRTPLPRACSGTLHVPAEAHARRSAGRHTQPHELALRDVRSAASRQRHVCADAFVPDRPDTRHVQHAGEGRGPRPSRPHRARAGVHRLRYIGRIT
jgi:hypothetical protein